MAAQNPLHKSKKPKGMAIVTDVDDGTKAEYDLPDPSKAGAIEVPKDDDGKTIQGAPDDPEETPEELAAKVGWTQRFGWPMESVFDGESLLDHTTWVEGKLPDKFFGGKLFSTESSIARV